MNANTIKQIESLGMTWKLMMNGRGEFSCAAWNHAGVCIAETGLHAFGECAIAELDDMKLGLGLKSGFSEASKYQTAMRLALKAWMLFVQDGSPAARRAYERMLKLAKSLRVPSGPDRGNLWIDIVSQAKDGLKFGLVNVVELRA